MSQIFIFLLEGALVISLLLFLFKLRYQFGLVMLYACLGMFQFLQVFLASTVYVELVDNVLVSPGSTIMFTATLFAVLLVYIKEGALETRKIIYTLIIINVIMAILLFALNLNMGSSALYNPLNIPANLFSTNAWMWLAGTASLFMDSVLIIILYEFISKITSKLFFRISLSIILVASFDTITFTLGAFWSNDNMHLIMFSGLISKGVFALYYSVFVYCYIKFFDKEIISINEFKLKDVFQILSYKQRFEQASQEKSQAFEEIREREIRYNTLANAMPVGVFHTTKEGITDYVNPKWCEISGMEESEAVGHRWHEATDPDVRDKIKKDLDNMISKGSYSSFEYSFATKDGTNKWILIGVAPEYNSKEEMTGYVGTITDITNLKIYQQEQKILILKAEESSKLKSVFLSNLSHEIRTPMNSILGFSELLMEAHDLNARERLQYLKIIDSSGRDMLNILSDIIDSSKIQSGITEVNFEETDINELMERLYSIKKSFAEIKGLEFSLTHSLPKERSKIETDPDKVSTILTHLLRNAIRYTDQGSIKFGCKEVKNNTESNSGETKESKLVFFVKDTGVGIPEAFQKNLFTSFFQYDIEHPSAFSGTGLGLKIAKSYTDMLGGHIWFESHEGKGSTFYFTLN